MSSNDPARGAGAGFECRLYGLDVVSGIDLFARRPHAAEVADVAVELGEPCDPAVETPEGDVWARWSTASGLTARFVRRADGSHVLDFEDTCRVVVDQRLDHVTVHMAAGVPEDMAGVLVSGTVLSYLLMLREEIVLHASAVDLGGRAVGFVGSSGMGKSTMATLMCRDGGLLITDDVLRLNTLDDGSGYGCALGATELRLRSGASALTDDFAADVSHRATADDRHALSVAPATREGVPLAALLIPRPNRESPELGLTRLEPAAAALTLVGFPRILGIRDQRLLASQLVQMSQVAERVPVFVADVPWGPPFPPDLSARVLSALDAQLGASKSDPQEVRARC